MNASSHLEPETIAALAEGKLSRRQIAAALAHIDVCARCANALEAANEAVAEERLAAATPRRTANWWMAAAAGVAIVAVGVIATRQLFTRSPIDRLIALAPRSARAVEPRLAGGFPWAAYRGPARATGSANDPERLKLGGVAGDLIDRADRDSSAGAQHDAGVAMVLIEDPLAAEERLRVAAERAPDDAAIWNDLAAARYAAAVKLDRPSLLPSALVAADRAVRLDARNAEGLFNRALILERMNLTAEARAAWQAYLAVDSSSPWAVEARERQARLQPAADFKREEPRLERAAASGDLATVQDLVARDPEQCRRLADGLYPARWADAVLRGDAAEAARMLAASRTIGEALVRHSGESLVRDAVAAIERGDRKAFAVAYAAYRDGRIAYSRRQLAEAESKLRPAADAFAALRSPMALAAHYFAANVRYDRNDAVRARAELAALLAEIPPRYAALGAQVRWELALCDSALGDYGTAIESLTLAESAFTRIGEAANAAFVQSLLASTLVYDGRPDDAWAWRIRSFRVLSGRDRGVALGGAARMELRAGRGEAALALLALERNALREVGDGVLLANALMRSVILRAEQGDEAGAAADAREAMAEANAIRDPSLRARARADAELAAGEVVLRGDPRAARDALTRAIDAYTASSLPAFLPECLLLRGRAALRLGDPASAAADFERGIQLLGDSSGGSGMLAAASALYADAIDLALERGDTRGAFAYAERMHPQPLTDVAELQRRLAGSGAVVLEIVTLPNSIAAFCVTDKDMKVMRLPIGRATPQLFVHQLLHANDTGNGTLLGALYDALIRPARTSIEQATELIVVADETTERIPFAALREDATRRFLVESLPVALAPSAGSLRRHDVTLHRSILTVGLSAGERAGSVALPEAAEELEDVRQVYASSATLPHGTFAAFLHALGAADVVHIAGHTAVQPGAGEPALLFDDQRVSWKSIAETSSAPPVVVLAACETLRRAESAQTRALSLAGAFVAAGAHDVIGTLAPIADGDARVLFASIHQQLARGESPAAAVRHAQLEAIAANRSAWRAIALLTTSIPEKEEKSHG